MKAYVLHAVKDIRYEEAERPMLKEGWALLEVMAAGICASDIPRIYETGTYHFPTVPGHEFSGIIREVSDTKYNYLIDKKVGVFPLIPCKTCSSCLNQDYEMCQNYNYLGSRTDGGFAEYVAVPLWNVIELPENISFEEAAMLEPMSVALHAMRQINLKHVNSIAIYGAGPIGLLIAEWSRILGIKRVFIIANKEKQVELANKLGFTNVCNSLQEDALKWILNLTEGVGTDVCVDGVGTSRVLGKCIELVCPKGDIIVVGNPKGNLELDKAVYWKVLRKQLRICGTWNSGFGCDEKNDWKMAVEALSDKKLNAKSLITHILSFDELEKGLDIMKEKREFYCKIMIAKG